MINLFGSILLDLSASFDLIVFLVMVITAGLTTVPIKFKAIHLHCCFVDQQCKKNGILFTFR